MCIADSVDQIWNAESRMVLIFIKIGNLKHEVTKGGIFPDL